MSYTNSEICRVTSAWTGGINLYSRQF